MGTVIVIDVKGAELHTPSNKVPELEWMQGIVGGYIERVHVHYKGKPTWMIVNEEGLLKGLPINQKATDIYLTHARIQGMEVLPGACIVGAVIILEGIRMG